MQVKDRVVVVTGGASGIGRALCRRFAADGAAGVAVIDQNAQGAAVVAEEIGGFAHGCDLGAEAEVNAMVQAVLDRYGRIDVFCNNAGIATGADPLSTPIDEWQRQWDVNVMAHVFAVRAVLPGMLERGEGYLLHTASMAGILTTHNNAVYAVTKHAVVGLAEWMALTYRHRGIRTFLLAPLGVRTPMLGDTDSDWARAAAGPVKEPEEVAQQVTDAFAEERFLIVTDPIALEWMRRKNEDLDRWLHGMNRLQQRLEAGG
ncbi:MAG: SDR family oxidoreductase [Acidimicrobiales bacterium]